MVVPASVSVTSVVGSVLQSTSTPSTVELTVEVVSTVAAVEATAVGVEVLAASRVVAPHPASSRVAVITPAAILVRRLIIVSCGLVSVP